MARLTGVVFTSHSGYTTLPPDVWAKRRDSRSYREGVPVESQEEMVVKWERTQAGIAALRRKIEEWQPDVLLVIGDDQEECFTFENHPSIAVYVGAEFSGFPPGVRRSPDPAAPVPDMVTVPGAPELAQAVLNGLLEQDFDPAFMTGLPRPEAGMSHAVMKVAGFFTDYTIPIVPVLINAFYAPQLTGSRVNRLGKALRTILDSYPEDISVAVIASGGLWHTPGRPKSWVNEEFDQAGLNYLREGDMKGWAAYFDAYDASDDPSQDVSTAGPGTSGLKSPGGPQFGTRESLCWITAGSMIEGRPATIVDYVPIYASPIGHGFAFSDVAS
ncbi:DODA-type extradiol aromatic ring-opening family dioxygenase [Nocardia sp. NPDC004123]